MVGKRLEHYEILEQIGAGGMGQVYRARDGKLDREVALKVLPRKFSANEDRLRRFLQEARAVAAMNHPNIVTIYSVEESGGTHFLTMELIKGTCLTEHIPEDGLPVAEFLCIALPLVDALSAAHDLGVVHRDLKPSNVMLGDADRLKVLDFGLAVEWVHEGDYVQAYLRDSVPGLPRDRPLNRVHLQTGKWERLQNDDPSWTVTRWLPFAVRLTASGDLLFWDDDWNVNRNVRP